MNKKKISIVKIGGNILDDPSALHDLIKDFADLKTKKILVHGGGKSATRLAEKLGVKTEFIDGRRITNKEMLDVAVMAYAGSNNKEVVAQLQAFGCNAIGISGADAGLILSDKRPAEPIDFGFVGDVKKVHSDRLIGLLNLGLTPVFCALTHDGNGQLFNTNADTIAAEVAISLASDYASELLYCFEKEGVLTDVSDENSVIPNLEKTAYDRLKSEGKIHSGMIPKLDNCFYALENGVASVRIGSGKILSDETIGTTIKI